MWMDQILATGDRQDQLTNILRLDINPMFGDANSMNSTRLR